MHCTYIKIKIYPEVFNYLMPGRPKRPPPPPPFFWARFWALRGKIIINGIHMLRIHFYIICVVYT